MAISAENMKDVGRLVVLSKKKSASLVLSKYDLYIANRAIFFGVENDLSCV